MTWVEMGLFDVQCLLCLFSGGAALACGGARQDKCELVRGALIDLGWVLFFE